MTVDRCNKCGRVVTQITVMVFVALPVVWGSTSSPFDDANIASEGGAWVLVRLRHSPVLRCFEYSGLHGAIQLGALRNSCCDFHCNLGLLHAREVASSSLTIASLYFCMLNFAFFYGREQETCLELSRTQDANPRGCHMLIGR